jgi:hypothetical protein
MSKKKRKTKGDKKPNRKRRKQIKCYVKKAKRGRKKLDKMTIKRRNRISRF